MTSSRRQSTSYLLGRYALDEVGRDRGGADPLGDGIEPGGSGWSQAQQYVPFAAHDRLLPEPEPSPTPSEGSAATRDTVAACDACTTASASARDWTPMVT